MLGIFGLTIIASLSGRDLLRGLMSGTLGLLIGSIGMCPQYGFTRYTFGQIGLLTGMPLVPALVGMFSISQILYIVVDKGAILDINSSLSKINRYKFSFRDLFYYPKIYLICGIVGVIVGIIPAAGASIAAFLGYDTAKRMSKTPEEFGKGCREGIAGPETANSGIKGGSLIPTMTLGIPGNAVTAVMMGAFMLHGMTPGHDLFSPARASITFPFIVGFFIANIMVLVLGLSASEQFAKVNRIPRHLLAPVILVLTVIGAFAIHNSYIEVYIMLAMGVLGYFLRRFDFDVGPLVLGFILGPIVERGFMRTLLINGGDINATLLSFVTRPICIVLLVLSILSIFGPLYAAHKAKKAKKA